MEELATKQKAHKVGRVHLTVATVGLGVDALPECAARRADVVAKVALDLHAARLAAGRGETTTFAVLVGGIADPVDTRVLADGLVERIHHNHLEETVARVLVNPVRVKHPKV